MATIFTKIKIKKLESFVVLLEKRKINKFLKNNLNFETIKLEDFIKMLFFSLILCFSKLVFFKN
jgi:hypothetical protein